MQLPKPREVLKNIPPYVPGKPIEEVSRELGITDILKLASNENPLGPSPKALEVIKENLLKTALYPEGTSPALRLALAKEWEMSQDSFLIGNGSDEIMQALAATFIEAQDEVLMRKRTFAVYEQVTKLFNGIPVQVNLRGFDYDLSAMETFVTEKTKLVFLANPNNPTGTIIRRDVLENFINKIPEKVLVVIDEAYGEYVDSSDFESGIKWVKEGRNVVVLRTFSKLYGLAGLRIGYGIARPELVSLIEKARLPFNVNRLAQVAAEAAFSDHAFIKKSLTNNQAGKEYLYQALDELKLPYLKTEANFICVNVQTMADGLSEELLKEGVIVRSLSSFGLPNSIRITIGTPLMNERLVNALKNVKKNSSL